MWAAQNELGWLSTEAMEEIGELLDVDPTDVNAVASFYTMFHLRPVGKQLIEVCQSPACWVNGAMETMHRLCAQLGIQGAGGGPRRGARRRTGSTPCATPSASRPATRPPRCRSTCATTARCTPEDVERFLQDMRPFNLEEPVPPVPGQSGPAEMARRRAVPTPKESARFMTQTPPPADGTARPRPRRPVRAGADRGDGAAQFLDDGPATAPGGATTARARR